MFFYKYKNNLLKNKQKIQDKKKNLKIIFPFGIVPINDTK